MLASLKLGSLSPQTRDRHPDKIFTPEWEGQAAPGGPAPGGMAALGALGAGRTGQEDWVSRGPG